MIRNKLKYLIGIIIVAIIISTIVISYKSIKPSASQRDIVVQGTLQLNNTGSNNYKEYLLSVNITKNKDCHIMMYPYVEGLANISFNEKEEEGYYNPGTVGSDGVTEPIARNELKSNNIAVTSNEISLIGFWVPYEMGQYKAKIYLDKLDTFKGIRNPVLVCVYTEKKYGKKLTWSKVVPLTIQ
jgi:hypothetical protein